MDLTGSLISMPVLDAAGQVDQPEDGVLGIVRVVDEVVDGRLGHPGHDQLQLLAGRQVKVSRKRDRGCRSREAIEDPHLTLRTGPHAAAVRTHVV